MTKSYVPEVNPGCPIVVSELALVFASCVTTVIKSLPKTCSGSSHVTLIVKLVPAAYVAEHEKEGARPLAFLIGAMAASVVCITPTAAL